MEVGRVGRSKVGWKRRNGEGLGGGVGGRVESSGEGRSGGRVQSREERSGGVS